MIRLEFEQGQHLCGLIERYFEGMGVFSFDWDDEPKEGDFVKLCRDFQPTPEELKKAKEIDGAVIALARSVLGFDTGAVA